MSENRSAAEAIYPAAATESAPAETPAQETPTETTASPETAAPETAPTLLTETTEEAKPEEAPAETPEPFDVEKVTFPEGMTKDDKLFGEFTEKAKAHGLSHAAAQDLIDLYGSAARDMAQQNQVAWQTVREGWVAKVKADPEIGGSKLNDVKRTVGKFLDDPAFGGPDTREGFEVTGSGDHPGVIRFITRLCKALSEGTHVQGNGPVLQASPRSLAQNIYPHLSQTER